MGAVSDRALCLRRFPYSESSLVVRLLTREHGRVHLLARGTYRPRSRTYALLDLFDTLELTWTQNPRRELGELVEGRIVRRRRDIPASLPAFRCGSSMLELAHIGSLVGQRDRPLFDLLERSLDRLCEPAIPAGITGAGFELGFLEVHGLSPALTTCASCGGEAPASPRSPARAAFSAGAGGRLCAPCADQARAAGRRVGTLPLDALDAAAVLRPFATGTGGPIELESDLLERVRDFIARFLDYHLGTRPRTHQAFLAAENRNAPR
ncbi:MAG: DNA repair protein RecO [Planctomycetota bacterium]|nr:DNA repair protein RecO [Planctomycetota bacterium]MDP6989691.1 DNA repair protein RecO [Planctomycetota bacterium]